MNRAHSGDRPIDECGFAEHMGDANRSEITGVVRVVSIVAHRKNPILRDQPTERIACKLASVSALIRYNLMSHLVVCFTAFVQIIPDVRCVAYQREVGFQRGDTLLVVLTYANVRLYRFVIRRVDNSSDSKLK